MFVRCLSCSKNISHRVPTCPFCGAPNDGVVEEAKPTPVEAKPGRPGKTVTQFCDHGAVADEAVREFQHSGFSLDYTIASIATLDLLLSDRYGATGLGMDEEWRPTEEHRKVIAMVGSYVGEVIRARYSGDWTDDPDHPGKPLFVQLDLGVSGVVWPLERAYRRLKNGDADSLLGYMESVQNEVTGGKDLGAAMDWASQASDFIKKDRLDVARTFIERALSIDPEHAEAWFCRGLVNERLGRKVDATFAYEQALRYGEHRDRGFRAHLRDKIEVLRKTSVSALAAQATQQPWATGDYPNPTEESGEQPAVQSAGVLAMRPTSSEPTVGDCSETGEAEALTPGGGTSGQLAAGPREQTGVEKVFGDEAIRRSTSVDAIGEAEGEEAEAETEAIAETGSPFNTETISPISGRNSGPLPVKALAASGVQETLTLPDKSGELPKADEGARLEDESTEAEAASPDATPDESPTAAETPAPPSDARPAQLAKTVQASETDEPSPEAIALAKDAASLVSRGQFEEASVCFREALGLSPGLDEARVGSATALLALARPADALKVLDPLVQRHHPRAVIMAGRALADDDRFDEAVKLIDGALQHHRESATLRRARAQHLYSLGNYVDAAASFEQSLQRDPTVASTWFGFANAALKLNDPKRSRLALAGYLGVAHPADIAGVKFAQRELTRLAVK